MARLLEVAIGMGIFVLAQSAWVTGHSRFDWGSPWVLEPAIGIAFCLGLFMLTTAVLAARRREPVSWGVKACYLVLVLFLPWLSRYFSSDPAICGRLSCFLTPYLSLSPFLRVQ